MIKKLLLTWIHVSVLLAILVGSAQADLNLANGWATGQWYNPARNGEGFWIEVSGEGDNLTISTAMYSYDAQGNQLWLVGSVAIGPNDIGATVPVILVEGPVWGTAYDPADQDTTQFGNIVVRFPTCDSALFNVKSNVAGLESGDYSLVRLTEITGMDCTEPAPPDAPPPPNETGITPGMWTGLGVCFFVNAEGTKIVETDECDAGNAFSADIPGGQVDIDGRFNPDLCDASVVCDGAWPIESSTDSNGVRTTQVICANTAGGIGEIRFQTGSMGFVRAYQGLDSQNGLMCYGPNTDVTPTN